MLKDNELIGVIGIYRTEVRPFTDIYPLGVLFKAKISEFINHWSRHWFHFKSGGESMPPPKKKLTPIATQLASISNLEQYDELLGLHEALRLHNVSGAVAAKVVEQQKQNASYVGYVFQIATRTFFASGIKETAVWVTGRDRIGHTWDTFGPFVFPPNDPMHLPELVRAQSNPHLRVSIYVEDISKPLKILAMSVISDYLLPRLDRGEGWPEYQPNFDLVEIKK
jgi:hypothetical protein